MKIDGIINRPEILEVARKAVEDRLVEFRDARISVMGRNNGLIIKEANGDRNDTIRLTIEQVIVIGLKAIKDSYLTKDDVEESLKPIFEEKSVEKWLMGFSNDHLFAKSEYYRDFCHWLEKK